MSGLHVGCSSGGGRNTVASTRNAPGPSTAAQLHGHGKRSANGSAKKKSSFMDKERGRRAASMPSCSTLLDSPCSTAGSSSSFPSSKPRLFSNTNRTSASSKSRGVYSWRKMSILAAFSVLTMAAAFRPQTSARRGATAAVAARESSSASSGESTKKPVHLAVLAPLDQTSTLGGASWGEVLQHMTQRLSWTDPTFHLKVYDTANLNNLPANILTDIAQSNAVIAFAVQDPAQVAAVESVFKDVGTAVAIGSAPSLSKTARINGMNVPLHDTSAAKNGGGFAQWIASIQAALSPAIKRAQHHADAIVAMEELYRRRSSDDLVLSFLVLINEAVRSVPEVANSTKRSDAGLPELQCMVTKCGKEIFGCLSDATCRTALDCLNSCSFNDQVCSYRCIASYESAPLAAFSLCILQKHNCLGLSAPIPEIPNPAPMASFQGAQLTHEMAEDLFVGWLRGASSSLTRDESKISPFSWRVFGGKNAAYDHFPCQFQLFFRGKARNTFWYQPVFKVLTVDGKEVWRDRVYRVRRDKTPGTFKLSVLDNGVTSLENWRVLDCDENLEWCAFYYSGAAKAAGLSYTGAILTSRSGDWPESAGSRERIEKALDRAGIKPWELSTVDNSRCDGPPLTPTDLAAIAV